MLTALKRHVRGNLVAYVALFVALGGVSYAAVKLPARSVGSRELKSRAVTPSKVAPSTIAKFRGARGATGVAGRNGTNGQPGAPGQPGTPGAPGPADARAVHADLDPNDPFTPFLAYAGVNGPDVHLEFRCPSNPAATNAEVRVAGDEQDVVVSSDNGSIDDDDRDPPTANGPANGFPNAVFEPAPLDQGVNFGGDHLTLMARNTQGIVTYEVFSKNDAQGCHFDAQFLVSKMASP